MAPVTAAFTVILALMLTALGINTSRLRGGGRAGPEKKDAIYRASRAHGNTFEHAIPVLLMMFFYEMNGGVIRWLCIIGTLFVIVRLSYVYGMLTKPASAPMVIGAAMTYLLELILAGLLVSRLV
jgi:uncharacterized membrane protein YecN with MAPEG domain